MRIISRLLVLCVFLALLAGGAFAAYFFSNRSYIDLAALPRGENASRMDDKLKIAIIGDSWASGEKFDEALGTELTRRGIQAEIVSHGKSGAKSKEILSLLTKPEASGRFLADKDVDIFVVFAGVNDSNGNDGHGFFRHHLDGIVSLIKSYGAEAILVDIPDYKMDVLTPPTPFHALKRQLSCALFDEGKRDNRSAYREEMQSVAKEEGVKILDYRKIPAYEDDPSKWKDTMHMNRSGYDAIAAPMADLILATWKKG